MQENNAGFFRRPEKFVTFRYQSLFFVVVSVMAALLLIRPIVQFKPVGPTPQILTVDEDLIARWGKEPVRVKTGLLLYNFLKFDMVHNEFVVNAAVWFTYDPAKVSLDTIQNFSFTKGELLEKSAPRLKKVEKNMTQATFFVRIKFSTILDYQRFPLDDHHMFLNLVNNAVTADEFIFEVEPDSFSFSEDLYVSGWSMLQPTAISGYTRTEVGLQTLEQPKAVFSCGVSKYDVRKLVLILLPLFLLFYFGLYTLSVKDVSLAIWMALASLSGQITYMLVIQGLSPAIGYFMLSDYLIIFFMSAIFVVLFVLGMIAIPVKFLTEKGLQKLAGWTVFGLNAALLFVWAYLTNFLALW